MNIAGVPSKGRRHRRAEVAGHFVFSTEINIVVSYLSFCLFAQTLCALLFVFVFVFVVFFYFHLLYLYLSLLYLYLSLLTGKSRPHAKVNVTLSYNLCINWDPSWRVFSCVLVFVLNIVF